MPGEIDKLIMSSPIIISKQRLDELELLEKNLPEIIQKAITDDKKAKLKLLHEKDKQNPAGVNARVKRYNAKNKDKINARRLLKRTQGTIPLEAEPETDEKFVIRF